MGKSVKMERTHQTSSRPEKRKMGHQAHAIWEPEGIVGIFLFGILVVAVSGYARNKWVVSLLCIKHLVSFYLQVPSCSSVLHQ